MESDENMQSRNHTNNKVDDTIIIVPVPFSTLAELFLGGDTARLMVRLRLS